MITDSLTSRGDRQTSKLNEAKPMLKQIQGASILDRVTSTTQIPEKEDLHLGVLLTMVSPRWFHTPTEGRVRGRVNTIIIGDSGTGKTSCSEQMFKYADAGFRVSGMTSPRTGITYACEYDEAHGWRVKAGGMLKMSRQALIADEAQDLPEQDLKKTVSGASKRCV